MSTYFALVHKDADSAFGIEFPDLPGCFSAADELSEIFRNAEVALSLYLSDSTSLPRPRPIEALRRDKAVSCELASGAFLIAVTTDRPGKPARLASSKAEKSVAASALTQKGSTEKTSAKVASTAAKVLKDPKASKAAKSAAASALTQKAGKGK